MIRKNVMGYDVYHCSRCGEETNEFEDYCQICGHTFNTIQNIKQDELVNDTQENETICVIIWIEKYMGFTFTQIKQDTTPQNLSEKIAFRFMREPHPGEYYVFKSQKYPHLREGTQINLNLDNYDSFRKGNGVVYFDRNHFSVSEINILKQFNYE